MSTNVNTHGRRGRIFVLLLVAVLGATTAAWAFWSQPGKGSASGHVAGLDAPGDLRRHPRRRHGRADMERRDRSRRRHRQLLRHPRRRRGEQRLPERGIAGDADELHRHGRIRGQPQLHRHSRVALVDRQERAGLGAGHQRGSHAPGAHRGDDDPDGRRRRQPDDHGQGRRQQHRHQLRGRQEPHVHGREHDRLAAPDSHQQRRLRDRIRPQLDHVDHLQRRRRLGLGLGQRRDEAVQGRDGEHQGERRGDHQRKRRVGHGRRGQRAGFTLSAAARTAGTAFAEELVAKDSAGNTATSYTGAKTITFSGPSNSPNGKAPVLPTISVTFTAGAGTTPGTPITLYDADEAATLTATQGSLSGTSASFAVNPAGISGFALASSPQTAGTPFSQAITAQDAYGNTATSTQERRPSASADRARARKATRRNTQPRSASPPASAPRKSRSTRPRQRRSKRLRASAPTRARRASWCPAQTPPS